MTAKEKAKELVDKYLNTIIHFPYIDTEDGNCIGTGYMTHQSAIRCALIACDELIKVLHIADTAYNMVEHIQYFQQVKEEINLLKQLKNIETTT
jgi:hypothetical protein